MRKGDLALIERVGDALALPKQPIFIAIRVQQAFLSLQSIVAVDGLKPARRAADQHIIWPEHRALGVDANTSARRTAGVQPPYSLNHGTNRAGLGGTEHPRPQIISAAQSGRQRRKSEAFDAETLLAHPQIVALGFVVVHHLAQDAVLGKAVERLLDFSHRRVVIADRYRTARDEVRPDRPGDLGWHVRVGGVRLALQTLS